MRLIKSLAATGLFVAATIAAPAAALTTFASISPSTTDLNVTFVNGDRTDRLYTSLTEGARAASGVPVIFTLGLGIPNLQSVASTFTLDAQMPDSDVGSSGAFSLLGASGSFSIIANNAVTTGGITGTNLLSGVFNGASLNGTIGETTGAFRASTIGGATITYSSDFLDFSDVIDSDFSLALTAVTNAFAPNGNPGLAGFRATIGGQFSSEPVPAFIPEPGTWAMLILGFGMVGISARRRQKVAVA
ncbi:hypothetical protein GCM10007973_28600 [Polymorphobacter multimanifer]|nr:hypothetical protein GCM10007973_28600 [Polymorphobacter multimanifer]